LGFLFGLGAIRYTALSPEARDIIKDISELTKLDLNADGEDDEQALSDIVEYLRVAVILLHTELNDKSVYAPS
jgi:uncharacterized protein YgfB (UPF0149 family)